MRDFDNFNIITGEVKTSYPVNSASKRFASLDLLKNNKLNYSQTDRFPDVVQRKPRKLGTCQDSKLFNYSYNGKDYNKDIY
jgi:hypothetical protein